MRSDLQCPRHPRQGDDEVTLFLIALIVGCLFAAALLLYSDAGYSGLQTFVGFIGVLLAIASAFGLVVYAFLVLQWIGAKHQADIINREYGTHYTQAEVFYASNVIDTVRELDRKRVELNGDLLRGESKK
jgi:hypothetical protein